MEMVIEFMNSNPQLAAVLVVMGVFRAVFKPVMVAVEKYVEATPSQDDDSKLAKFKEGKVYRVLSFLADYLMSVKLPK